MDASDEAAGCALQQIQPITVKDLKGMRAYDHLKRAFEAGLPPPKLTTSISSKTADSPNDDQWGEDFESSTVHVERVIAYWSRTFKGAETRYSTTEREALAAKEGLVKFQPYIEGEAVLLITDHLALQWARTYENANRRLAAWGAVFSAYAPKSKPPYLEMSVAVTISSDVPVPGLLSLFRSGSIVPALRLCALAIELSRRKNDICLETG